jgi:amino acid permease
VATYTLALVVTAGLTLSAFSTTINNEKNMKIVNTESVRTFTVSAPTAAGSNLFRDAVSIRQIAVDEMQYTAQEPVAYPPLIKAAAAVVVTGTFVSALIGYFLPGPLTGAALPLAATCWWILYRMIKRYDEQRTAS